MTDRRTGFFARLSGLFRGMMSGWMRDREEDNPRAVYENAIAERVKQYRQLKDAVAGILYMRNKLEAELCDRREELARTLEDIRRAVRRGDDEVGLALIQRKQALIGEIDRAEGEFVGLKNEAEEAKGNLVRFREEIRSLEHEKGQTLARIANASARRRIKNAIDGLSVDADMRALENVRTHVAKLNTENDLDKELGIADDVSQRIKAIRQEAHDDASRRELEELKREMGSMTISAEATEVRVPTPASAAN
jgi:phage shock protein A